MAARFRHRASGQGRARFRFSALALFDLGEPLLRRLVIRWQDPQQLARLVVAFFAEHLPREVEDLLAILHGAHRGSSFVSAIIGADAASMRAAARRASSMA